MSSKGSPPGYAGDLLRVDLSSGTLRAERLEEDCLRRWVGGTGLGTHYLYEAVKPGIEWSDPRNIVAVASGPLAGSSISGAGTFSAVFKGPMTNLAGATQANGYFGAFMRFCGYDGFVLEGISDRPVYLLFTDEGPQLRDASDLWGLDTNQTEDALHSALGLGERQLSVFSVGPAAEHGVLFTGLVGDRGHIAAHNGLGAVLARKRVKAIVAVRGKHKIPFRNPERLKGLAAAIFEHANQFNGQGMLYNWGTGGGLSNAAVGGWLPIRNYQTSVFPEHEQVSGMYVRQHFAMKPSPCWACRMGCCKMVEVTEGPYKGVKGEEPEYEGMAAFGPQVGVTEAGAMVMLCNEVDRLGMDVNEAGWVVGFALEAYERGILGKADADGLDLTWGNAEAIRELLNRIARCEGVGELLCGGVKRAAERLGGDALDIGVYTMKGSSPRGHDHRGRWAEMLDTCTGNTGTIEATFGGVQWPRIGRDPVKDRFSPEETSRANAQFNGWHQFDDSLGICRFIFCNADLGLQAFNAATGWDFTVAEAMEVGLRIVNQLRVFNIQHGLSKAMERPSSRYGSTPIDGPVKGVAVMPHWDHMLRNYYAHMGWDPDTGKPLPETLVALGLGRLVGTY
jgi:aldehyde:ferredoxin oxidoreductase